MTKTKQKREILAPATKGSVSSTVLAAKILSVPRVETTDVVLGDRVVVFLASTREQVAGKVVYVSGSGQQKKIRVQIVGYCGATIREFVLADCRITKVGKHNPVAATLGFLKGGNVGQVIRPAKLPKKK